MTKVFANDVDDDIDTCEFTFMQLKRLATDPTQIRYDWPKTEDVDIVNVERCFYGPVMPVIDKTCLSLNVKWKYITYLKRRSKNKLQIQCT